MFDWYNIIRVFFMNHPEVGMALLIACAAALAMRGDIFAKLTRYAMGIAVLVGAGYMMLDILPL
ncbi:MAG: hypothetical protein OER85_18655 [Gammaproteobacteria bacterium]|nr:hypothetical protein [Gammaproteobacteria bacterium]